MISQEQQERLKAVKLRIEKLIEAGNLIEAKAALDKIAEKVPGDPEVCSMMAVIHIIEGSLDRAEAILVEGLKMDSFHYDLLFNLAYISEQYGQYEQANMQYSKAYTVANDDTQRQNVNSALDRLREQDSSLAVENRAKIIVFVKAGMDSFLGDIITGLSDEYWVRKIIVSDFKQIDAGMEWADVCWFEWCDELVAYGSRLPLAQQRKIVCRLHRYEVFTDMPSQVAWENVDKLIIVTRHLQDILETNLPSISKKVDIRVFENGVDVDKFVFNKRSKGFNLAMVGYIHSRKNPVLLLQIIKKLVDIDKRYKLYIAGAFQEQMVQMYWEYQVVRMGLGENVIFEGWQKDINTWLEDKNYLLSTSIHESFGYGIAEAMARGIKPVIYDFLYANEIWDDEFLFSTVDEAVESVLSKEYDSNKYRNFIEDRYSLTKQITQVHALISELLSFRRIVGRVDDILKGKERPIEFVHENLTILIPNYNRAKMLRDDLVRGLKLGNQPKLIIDDNSTAETEFLDLLQKNKAVYNADVIRKQVNEGPAHSRWTGLKNIWTRFTAFVDDDDMLLCVDREQALIDIEKLNNGYVLMIPRYMLNLGNDAIELGYDRNCYNGISAAEVLKHIALNSEIKAMLAGGSIGCTDVLKEHAFTKEFIVAEDFVMLSRLMSANPEMKIGTTEALVHIRRVSGSTLSRTLSPHKLALGLIAQCIACYHCVQLGIASQDEVLEWMKNRAALIQKLYDFGKDFEAELIDYLTGGISEEVFAHFLALHGFRLFDDLDELAPELKWMRSLYHTEVKKVGFFLDEEKPPLVSVIIPTFNREEMLKRAIDQVLKQDYPNIEVIVSDNCSEDRTEEMVRSRYKDESRLVYHRNEKNIGPVLNGMNGFYNLSSGKYCLMLCDDDYLIDSTYISSAVELLERRPDVVYVFGGLYYNMVLDGKVNKIISNQPQVVNGADYFVNFKSEKYPIMPSINTIVFRRDIVADYRCMQSLPNAVAGDRFFQLRMLFHGNVGFIKKVAVVYNLHIGSMSRNLDNRVVSEDDSGGEKAVATAVDDIKEFKTIYETAVRLYKYDKKIMDIWLSNKIHNYLYWRFNETVRTKQEIIALLGFLRVEHNGLYDIFRRFIREKYDIEEA